MFSLIYCFIINRAVSDLGVGLRLCKLNLEIKHLWGRLLLQLSGGFLLAGQLSVHLLQKHKQRKKNIYTETHI